MDLMKHFPMRTQYSSEQDHNIEELDGVPIASTDFASVSDGFICAICHICLLRGLSISLERHA